MTRKHPPEAPGSPRERFRREGWHIFIRCRAPDRQYTRAIVDHLRDYYGLRIWFDEYSLGEIREVRREIEMARRSSRFEIAVVGSSWNERPWRWLPPAELHSKEEGEAWLVGQRPLPGSATILLPGFRPSLRQQFFSRMPRPRFRSYGKPQADAAAIVRLYRAYRILRSALILAFTLGLLAGLIWLLPESLAAHLRLDFSAGWLWAVFLFLAALLIPSFAWYFYLAWYFNDLRRYVGRR